MRGSLRSATLRRVALPAVLLALLPARARAQDDAVRDPTDTVTDWSLVQPPVSTGVRPSARWSSVGGTTGTGTAAKCAARRAALSGGS